MKYCLILITSTLFFTLSTNKSPFYMNLSIILLVMSLAAWMLFNLNKWVFSVMIIFYLGGMMVLFSYIISLNKSKYNFFKYSFFLWVTPSVFYLNTYASLPKLQDFFFNPYHFSMSHFLFILAIVLLVLLFIINKICMSQFGPMIYKQND